MANNQYPDCPPLMADGRHLTTYQPRCMQEYVLRDANGRPLSSYAYRQYLVNHAEELLASEVAQLQQAFGCGGGDSATVPPPLRTQECDAHGCGISPANFEGVGLERVPQP